MSIFIWEDGARFDDAMNDYMSEETTTGIDPRFPLKLLGNTSGIESLVNASEILAHDVSIQ